MQPQNATKAGTGVSGPDLRITNRLASAIGNEAVTPRQLKVQALRRLTARLDALCVWRDDIQRRIEHARELQERGALFRQEQDDLIDAVRSWRLAAARVGLDLEVALRNATARRAA